MSAKPRVRGLEPIPVQTPDGEMWVLRDPAGLADEVAVSPFALYLLMLMDGTRELSDVQAEVTRRTGEILPVSQLEQLVADLDARHVMDSPAFAEHVVELERAFAAAPVRPSAFAGKCYPEDADGTRRQLDAYFTAPPAPGETLALVAPHIDLPRGGPVYADAYRVLPDAPPELVIVLGTSHVPTGALLTFTRKHYRTPLGEVPSDAPALDRLERAFGPRLYTGEMRHRTEHSVEFQMLFLRHRWPDAAFTALPVLCGSPHEQLLAGETPEALAEFARMVDELAQIARGRRTLIIASADLAHVGPQFGDPAPLEDAARARLEESDRAMLAPVLAGERDAFRERVWGDGDRNRICGFMPIYTTLALLDRLAPRCRGELLGYKQWPDPRAVVSYASIAFTAPRS